MPPDHNDRSLGLVVFGVIEVVIGGCCLLLVPLTLAALVLGESAGGACSDLRSAVSSSAVYVVTAGVFVWLGIGSIRARRWACELLVSLSWIWLVTGLCSMAIGVVVLPAMMGKLAAEADMPPSWLLMINLVVFGIAGFVYLVLPAALLIFYRSPDVAATCRIRDPRPQWVDRCPRRLVTLATVWLLCALSILLVPAYNFFFPAFGTVLTGVPGAVLWTLTFAVCVAVAVGTFRRSPWAWRTGMALSIAGFLSSTVTFFKVDYVELAELMGLPAEQAAILTAVGIPEGWPTAAFNAVVWTSFIVYLMTLQKYFTATPPDTDG
jgi:hypothetical protein